MLFGLGFICPQKKKKNHKNQTFGTLPEKTCTFMQDITSRHLLNLKVLILLLLIEQRLYTLALKIEKLGKTWTLISKRYT